MNPGRITRGAIVLALAQMMSAAMAHAAAEETQAVPYFPDGLQDAPLRRPRPQPEGCTERLAHADPCGDPLPPCTP